MIPPRIRHRRLRENVLMMLVVLALVGLLAAFLRLTM